MAVGASMLDQLATMSPQQLLEVTQHGFWLCCEGKAHARETFRAIHEEHLRRGTVELFRRATRPVVDAVRLR
jgi:hypothetical protein